MGSQLKLIGAGLLGSLALTFIILGCVISRTWWMLFLFVFYILTPIPLLFIRDDEYESMDGSVTSKSKDIAIFFVAGIVVSTLAFPILLSYTPVEDSAIDFPTAFLSEFATVILYLTVALFFNASSYDTSY